MAARVTQRQVEALVAEIYRYLDTVEAFRSQGREPRWRAELSPAGAAGDKRKPRARTRRGSSKPRKGGSR